MYFHFACVLVFLLLGAGFVALMLWLGKLLRPHNPEVAKLTTYECGEVPTGAAWMNFNMRFYIIALVFVIFDVEVAFLYPVLVVFKDWVGRGEGLFALVEISIFLVVLFLGLVYVWAKRDLEWLKRIPAQEGEVGPPRGPA